MAEDHNLIQIAAQLADDDLDSVDKLVKQNSLAFVADKQARQWYELDSVLWSVVVAPFVLVQENHQSLDRQVSQ